MRVLRHGNIGHIEKECGNCHALLEIEETDIQIDRRITFSNKPWPDRRSFEETWHNSKVAFGPKDHKFCCICADCGFRIPLTFDELPAQMKTKDGVDFFAQFKEPEAEAAAK